MAGGNRQHQHRSYRDTTRITPVNMSGIKLVLAKLALTGSKSAVILFLCWQERCLKTLHTCTEVVPVLGCKIRSRVHAHPKQHPPLQGTAGPALSRGRGHPGRGHTWVCPRGHHRSSAKTGMATISTNLRAWRSCLPVSAPRRARQQRFSTTSPLQRSQSRLSSVTRYLRWKLNFYLSPCITIFRTHPNQPHAFLRTSPCSQAGRAIPASFFPPIKKKKIIHFFPPHQKENPPHFSH